MQGDDYQARFFWLQAMRMFEPLSPVIRVGIEQGKYPWFDDVVTEYAPTARSVRRPVDAHQIKFHIVADGALSIDTLMDPAFVNSATTSLAQRIVEAYRARNGGADVVLLSPWGIDHRDFLAKLVQVGRDGSLRTDALFDGKTRSDAAQVRNRLIDHLACDEDTLRRALDRFRVITSLNINHLRDWLDDKLGRYGFACVGQEQLGSIYDDIARKLIAGEDRSFDRAGIAAILRDHDLQVVPSPPDRTRVGIRSFLRYAEYLDEYTTLLDLLDSFDGRHLKSGCDWTKIASATEQFMRQQDAASSHELELHLSCHSSIAYAAGAAISSKSVTRYVVHQVTRGGSSDFDLSARDQGEGRLWDVAVDRVRDTGLEVAVAFAVTHQIGRDVRSFVRRALPNISTLIILSPSEGCNSAVVRDGGHAIALAESAAQTINDARTPEQRRHALHMFSAAPNALIFALGRMSARLGSAVLYEFDFESNDPEAYSPAIILDNGRKERSTT